MNKPANVMKIKGKQLHQAVVLEKWVWFQRGSAAEGNKKARRKSVTVHSCDSPPLVEEKSERPPEIQLDEDRLALFACTQQTFEKGLRHRTSCCSGCVTCGSSKRSSPFRDGRQH